MTQKAQTVSEALRRAQEEEEDVFLARLNKQELEKSGFDTSTFGEFSVVDVYLQYWDGEFTLKYEFDDDPRQTYYEKENEVGGRDMLLEIVEEYLDLGGE